jgi:hypothetical protein
MNCRVSERVPQPIGPVGAWQLGFADAETEIAARPAKSGGTSPGYGCVDWYLYPQGAPPRNPPPPTD